MQTGKIKKKYRNLTWETQMMELNKLFKISGQFVKLMWNVHIYPKIGRDYRFGFL